MGGKRSFSEGKAEQKRKKKCEYRTLIGVRYTHWCMVHSLMYSTLIDVQYTQYTNECTVLAFTVDLYVNKLGGGGDASPPPSPSV